MPSLKNCKWGGDGCEAAAGFGTFGSFCETHAERLASVDMSLTRRAAVREVKREAEPAEPQPDAVGRLPLHVRAARLGHFVQGAGQPVSQTEAAEAIGLASAKGSLPKVVREARARGYLAPGGGPRGRGYQPGPVEAPEPEPSTEAA